MRNKHNYFFLGKLIKSRIKKYDFVILLNNNNICFNKNIKFLLIELDGILIPFLIKSYLLINNKFLIDFEFFLKKEYYNITGSNIYLEFKYLLFTENVNNNIIGFNVKDINKGFIGVVIDIYRNLKQDLFKVYFENKYFLIPITKVFIKEININEKYILTEIPFGLIE
ncbi:MAG: hypothetical protein NHF94_00140 [Candidatus Bostrichicola ureolyticus]|nr:MAG: hypothetical protein NHF94_00140 [Candidatus Bostrichicola ureolyticus]